MEHADPPIVSHLVLMVLTGLLAAFVPVTALGEMTSIGTLLAFAIVCGGVQVLRVREPDRPRPFHMPASPATPAVGIGMCLLLTIFLPWPT